MNQPLGHAVGNALEMKEAIDTLHGKGPADFKEHCLVVASHLLLIGGKARDLTLARWMAEEALDNGKAWEMFRKLIQAQGGNLLYVDEPQHLPQAPFIETINAPADGFIEEINARVVGETSVQMGAGRARKGDTIDHAVGLVILRKVGDKVEKGDPLFIIHARTKESLHKSKEQVLSAFAWSTNPVESLPLFYGVITGEE
jgi:pyrimidine-nucleoside phosphorylase